MHQYQQKPVIEVYVNIPGETVSYVKNLTKSLMLINAVSIIETMDRDSNGYYNEWRKKKRKKFLSKIMGMSIISESLSFSIVISNKHFMTTTVLFLLNVPGPLLFTKGWGRYLEPNE